MGKNSGIYVVQNLRRNMNRLGNWFQFFEKISCFYAHKLMNPLWDNKEYKNHLNDLQESICLFLEGYAFERNLNPQTRNRWSKAAVNAVQRAFSQHEEKWDPQIIKQVWDNFKSQIANPNPKVNPLAPRGVPYKNKSTNQLSFLEAIDSTPAIKNSSFTRYMKQQISQDNILLIYGFLTRINGISDKISSFFLRDLVEIFGIKIYPDEREILFQPIDTHVRKIIKSMNESINLDLLLVTDLEFKVFIVSNARIFGLNPRKINMGMWYFRSQILEGDKKPFPGTLTESEKLCEKYKITEGIIKISKDVCEC